MQRMLLTLLDGTTVFIRPIAPEDKQLLVSGLRNLSPETAYRRLEQGVDGVVAEPGPVIVTVDDLHDAVRRAGDCLPELG